MMQESFFIRKQLSVNIECVFANVAVRQKHMQNVLKNLDLVA